MKHNDTPQNLVSDGIIDLCTSPHSVSSLLAENPNLTPKEAWERLYGAWKPSRAAKGANENASVAAHVSQGGLSKEDLERIAKCGKWGPTQPSDLFLKIFNDSLSTLDDDPLRGMVSPSLMGSCGVVPLTIISVIPDIARHMSNLIVRAEKEVILATNYWQHSVASTFLIDAIRELDRRSGRKGVKVVVKIIYDRGSPKQLFEPHYYVPEKEYTGENVKIPAPSEIPNIDLQVINFHTPLVGTFHAKYMVVDRKIGILQSNNIQDNDNLEMMVHLEGLIVDSLYDMALISWHKKLEPPLPSHDAPAAEGGLGAWPDANGSAHSTSNGTSKIAENGKAHEPGVVSSSAPIESSDRDRADVLTGPSTTNSTIHPHLSPTPSTRGDTGNYVRSFTPNGAPDVSAEGYLNRGDQALPESRIQNPSPGPGKASLPDHTLEDPHYDDDIAGEVARIQASVSPKSGESRMDTVARLLNHTTNKGFVGNRAPECPPGEEMTPYIAHPAHQPFPMALVNRSPYGPPTHKSVSNPQNAAWLSALRHAKHSVFIQTPTLNAEPLLPAIIAACERGVDVICFVCLGYNDMGELLPHQNGHNEHIAHTLLTTLSPAARSHLHYAWYVAKDQTRPLVQATRNRSCHIKLMIVDEHIGIQGNGNQDTQSWFHSQEINVMIDSEEVCKAWIDGLRRNQNTHVYGWLGREDGVWRDGEGKEVEGAMGVGKGMFSWLKGMKGAVRRVKGTGGF